MRCSNCGANIDDNMEECSFCGTVISREVPDVQPVKSENLTDTQKTANSLIGKEYDFSGNDLMIRGRWGVRVNVKVGDDRLYFETYPARKNVLPAIMLEDIMAIEEKFYMRTTNKVIAIIGGLLGCSGAFVFFLIPIFVLLLYRERQIKIHMRNGNILTIYSDDRALAEEFVEDMKKITKIKQ